MPGGKRRRPFSLVVINPTSIQNMLLGLEMVVRVDQSFVKVYFHKMTTEYSNWMIDKIVGKEAKTIAMREQFLRDNREKPNEDNYELKRRDMNHEVPIIKGINNQQKKKRWKTK